MGILFQKGPPENNGFLRKKEVTLKSRKRGYGKNTLKKLRKRTLLEIKGFRKKEV